MAKSASIVAYKQVSPTLFKVAVTHTKNADSKFIASAVSKSLKNSAMLVEGSLHKANIPGVSNVSIGYIKANREVRLPTELELKSSYKILSSNILMSKDDSTLWELKKNKNTTYLAKKGHDDLSELVNMVTASAHPVSGITSVVQASVIPEKYDFITFINSSGDIDHGFVLASNSEKTKVVAYNTLSATVVSNNAVLDSHECKIDPLLAKTVKRKLEADTKDGSLNDMETYYRELYQYSPEYINEIIRQIDEMRGRV